MPNLVFSGLFRVGGEELQRRDRGHPTSPPVAPELRRKKTRAESAGRPLSPYLVGLSSGSTLPTN